MKLFSRGNPKTIKGEKKGFMTFIMHLAPSTLSGFNVCPMASKGCAAACLNTAGRGRMTKIQEARVRKTLWFFNDRAGFMEQLVKDIQAGIRQAEKAGLIPVFRLNGTSDIRWENEGIIERFPDVQFYDYTKLPNRRNIPANYHLTFSRSESNDHMVGQAIQNHMNVAVVFDTSKGSDLPNRWGPPLGTQGGTHRLGSLPVIDGDENDLRFLDPAGVIVGLRAKGDGKKDTSGFVIHV